MTTAQLQAAREERVLNNIATADREAAQAARTSLLGRIIAGDVDFDPDDLSDEELASVFPAFAVVMCDVVHTLATRKGARIG